jgi:hypothetical protein
MTEPTGVIPYPGHPSDMENKMRDYVGRDLLGE